MKKIILGIVILLLFYIIYQIVNQKISKTQTKDDSTTKKVIHNKQNQQFFDLYEKNKQIDQLLLEKYKQKYQSLEKKNFEHSYTPTKLLDKRVRVHINLDNDLFKDNLGL